MCDIGMWGISHDDIPEFYKFTYTNVYTFPKCLHNSD